MSRAVAASGRRPGDPVGVQVAGEGWDVRVSRTLVLAICIGYGFSNVVWSVTAWEIPDIGAYWNAALRLQAGAPLYPPVTDVNASDVYRYAPWFAFLWVPLTYLPRSIVDALWSGLLVASSVAVIIPALRVRSPAALAFTALAGGFLILIASRGNVQPLMVAALVYGVERRSGPLWIAACASLKATPILFVLVYFARGEYRKAAVTLALTAALVLPMLAFGVQSYTTDPGASLSLYAASPILYAVVAATSVAIAAYVAWRHPRYGWAAAAVAVVLCLPRFFPYEFTFLFVGLVPIVDAWRRRSEDRYPA